MKCCPECSQSFASDDWRCPACGFEPRLVNGFRSFAQPDSGDGFKPEYFTELAGLEEKHFWFRARNALLIETIKRYLPSGTSLLEVGCGTGYVLTGLGHAFPEMRLVGSEYFSEGLAFAARRVSRAQLLQADARNLPFCDEFDIVGAFDVLEHIEEDEKVLAQFQRVLRPGGGLVLTVPQHPWLWSCSDDYACHVRRYGRDELMGKVERSGFRVVFATSFVSLLLPVLILSRLRQKRRAAGGEELAELRLSRMVNTCCGAMMTLERGMIKTGIKFPVGGSLLLVAQKV